MLPSNGFTYNFNGPSLNQFGQLSIHHPTAHLNSSIDLIDNVQTDGHTSIDDNVQQHNQLYELHPHQQTTGQLNSYNQTSVDNSNKEPHVLSLFKLKNYLNQPKKLNTSTPMQSMFSTGQELTSTGLQLLSSSGDSSK